MKQLFTPLFILFFVFCFFSSLFTSAQSTYYVNDNNTGNDVFTTAVGNNANAGTAAAPFATLQHAVTQAAANDIIYVDAGSYAEQVIINKGITIIGAGQTLSLFSPPATALVPAPGPFSEIGLFVTTQGIGDVHISHVSINSNGSSQNIIIQSGGSVSNCTLLNGDQGVFFRIESDVKTAVVESNIIQPNGIGINCQGSGLTASIRNNNITKAGGFFAGIYSGLDFGPLPNLTIQNNIIHNYFGDGMLVASFNGNYNLNSIFGSGSYAINRYNNGGTTPNVSCNWFNSADGVFIASKISGTVVYTPWLTDGTDNNAAVGFQPLAGTCVGGQKNIYVNDNNTSGDVFTTAVGNDANAGTSSAPVATITIALTKANPGDIILVDAGNYTEQVTITKNITVRGAGMGVTIINGPNGSIAPPPNFGEKGILQTGQGLSDVIIENLTIDGTNSDEIHSILIQGGGRVSNCEMRNANNGFFFRDHSGTMRTAIGNNNYIHNISFVGILFAGYNMNATATANIIDLTGALYGMGFIAGYGGDGDLASFTATNNNIMNFNGWGFYVHSRQSSQIHDNSLTRAAGNFMVNNNAVVMNATCNWYGTADGNVIIPNISGAVTYISWLTNGTDNDAAFGFQPVAGVCNGVQTDFYVNDANTSGDVLTTAAGNNSNTGVSGAPFATLEYALNIAPAGSTIYVDAGTYITPNLSINKSITIRGANYLISPNDASNILLANAARNSESIISGSTFTIDASNITITGLTLDPGNKSAVVLSNTSFGNFKFSKNKSILNSGNFISLTGASVASPAIPVATGFDFVDNRFEKLGTTGGITFVVNYINSINIDKNSFVVTGPTPRTQVTGAFGQTGLVYNIRFTDNLVDKPNYYMFTSQVSQMVISGNKLYNANFGLLVQITYAGSSDVSIENNYIESNMPANTILACRFFGGNNTGSSSAGKVRNNTITINATGLTTIGAAISTQMAGITLNPSFEISGNKILHTGNFNLFTTSNLIGLNVAGKLENTSVSNNEISFTGTNLVSPNPSAPNALFTSAIVISTDGGTINPTAPGSVLTVQNNKLSGYKQSIALFDAVNQAPNTYTGYGNLPSGVIVNIHNNSLTGDSLSINNGTSGQSVNASCNWYGSAAEDIVKFKISGTTVQHIPWLTDGTDNDVATGFQPLANVCNGYPRAIYVNDNNQTGDVFTTAVGNDANIGIASAPLLTISAAITKALPGDTIFIDAGDYPLTISVDIPKTITILGPNYLVSPNNSSDKSIYNTARNTEAKITGARLVLGADGIIIKGIRFTPSGNAFGTALNTNLKNITVEKNYFDVSSGATTVQLSGTAFNPTTAVNYLLSDNRFSRIDLGTGPMLDINGLKDVVIDNNVFIETTATPNRGTAIRTSLGRIVENINITNNYIKRVNNGILTFILKNAMIQNNVFDSCSQGFNMTPNTHPGPLGSSNITIIQNTFKDLRSGRSVLLRNGENGVSNLVISQNNIQQSVNGINGIVSVIQLEYINTAVFGTTQVLNNIINISGDYSTSSAGSNNAIQLTGNHSNTTISGNELNFSAINSTTPAVPGIFPPVPTGIYIRTDGGAGYGTIPASAVITIANNKVNGFKSSVGIYDPTASGTTTDVGYGFLTTGATITINNNSFINDEHSINNGTVSQKVNATCNWYGSSSGDVIKFKVSGITVQHIPWLTDGTDNDVAVGFQPLENVCNGYPRALYVNDNSQTGDRFTTAIGSNSNPGTASAPFATIDYAYTLAKNGDTIYVDAGEYIYAGELFIQKAITFIGRNYDLSPNDATDAKVANAAWVAESKITGGTLTILSNDLTFKGFAFNPGLRPAVSLNNTPTSNNNFGNLNFTNNRFIVTQASSQVILVGVGTGATAAAALINSGFTISNNRFEKSAAGGGSVFSVHLVKNVTITDNAFVIGTSGAIRTATAVSMGNVGVVDNVNITNNTVDRFATFVTGNQYANAAITNNKVFNTTNALNINNNMPGVSVVEFSNNLLDGSSGVLPFAQYVRTGGNGAGSSTLYRAENNQSTVSAAPGTTILLGTFLVQYGNSVQNPAAIIRGNTINMGGDLSTVEGQFIRPINIRGNLGNITVENNEITLSGTNLQPRNPANPLPVCPAITLSPENGVNAVLQPSAVVNILNNKVHGFKQSFIVFDPVAGASPYVGFGNLPEGVTVNVNNNSFTGDSISVNNGADGGGNVNAACNWYGSATAQDIINKLVLAGNLDIVPWLTNGTDNDAATGFQPVPGACDGYPTLITLNNSNNVTCNGAANGSINITASFGKAPIVFTWTKEEDANFISHDEDPAGLAPGTYHLSIVDGNGSNVYVTDPEADGPGTITITITEPDVLTAAATGSNNVCFNGSIGTASVTPVGGTAPYTYLWGTGASTDEISNLAAGIYTVTVTDANGCTTTASYEVTQPTQVTASITNVSTACSNIATASADGGTPGYTYLWSNGSTSATISGVPVGTYTVTVTDANGCTTTATVNLTVSEAFNPSASVTNVSCFGGNNGIITVTNANGTAPFMFSKDGGVTFVSGTLPYSFTNLLPGTYTIAVKDANGCVGFIDRTVAQPTQLVASLNTVQSACFNQSNGAVSVTVTGGVTAYTYRWTGPNGYTSSQLNISGLAAGNYTLTVTDKNGCTYILPVEVQSISEIVVNESISNITCRGAANGSISATANGGTNSLLGFSYLWNTGSTATTISNLAPGNYNVRITDNGSGCFINKSYIITQPASALALTTTKTNATGCSSLGTITATGSGGTSPYNYSVNGITISGNSIGSLYAGDYTVSVTDANGCTTSKLVTITDNGSDEYEGNNSKNQAKPMPAGGSLTARLAVANDAADWFRFTAPVSASGLYSVKMTHPNTVYTFNVYASGNNTPPIAPTSVINSGEKHYQLTAGTTYFVSITTATLSFVCYNLTVSALEPIEITANTPPSSITVEAAPTVDLLKAFTYPNPHNGNFTLSIESPEDAVATIEMFTVNGQKLSERKANVVKGKGNTVKYSNMNYAILFYKVRIGSSFVTGKIISPN